MVKLNRVTAGLGAGAATVLLKLEMQNPGGSVKDRIAAFMIEQAEHRGEVPERPSSGALLLTVALAPTSSHDAVPNCTLPAALQHCW